MSESLNGFHESRKFTYEKEKDGVILLLDVKVITNMNRTFDTDIHRKHTDTNLYMSWNSFPPRSLKIGIQKNIIRRAYT